jgi:hypothetical protein
VAQKDASVVNVNRTVTATYKLDREATPRSSCFVLGLLDDETSSAAAPWEPEPEFLIPDELEDELDEEDEDVPCLRLSRA